MAQNSKGAEVQAMPIESDTFIGIASNHKPIGGTIQVVDGCNLTFHFPTGDKIITAEAPLAQMFGYATALRSLTQGRATYTMEPSFYKAVPKDIMEQIVSGGIS